MLTAIAQAAFLIGAVIAGFAVQRAGLIPTILAMGIISVVLTIGMFFNQALRGMDVRREPAAERTDVGTAARGGETMMASRTTAIH